jgi:membrane protein implicated in regulation of membrane protease activity
VRGKWWWALVAVVVIAAILVAFGALVVHDRPKTPPTSAQIEGAYAAVTLPAAQVTQLDRDDLGLARAYGLTDSQIAGLAAGKVP